MIIVLSCAALLVVGIFWHLVDEYSEAADFCRVAGTFLTVCIIPAMLISRAESSARATAEYPALVSSLKAARENPAINPLELAALQQNVVEFNAQLAQGQYWARHPLTDWFYADSYRSLEPIR